MNADEARKITDDNLKGPAIEAYVEALDKLIGDVARKGKGAIDPMVVLYRIVSKTDGHVPRDAVKKHYEARGYRWVDHVDPDPGHPASRPYTTLSW